MEKSVFTLGGGYAGIYAYNSDTDRFDLVNSAYMDDHQHMTVDLEVGGVEVVGVDLEVEDLAGVDLEAEDLDMDMDMVGEDAVGEAEDIMETITITMALVAHM